MSFSRSRSRSPDTFRKRRETYWDVKESPYGVPLPPAGMSAMSGHAEGQGNAVPAPNPAAAAQAVAAAIAPNAVVPPASVAQQMQAGELAATMAQPTYQATRHARRLYVGNLPADSTDADVSEFFNKSMTVAGGVESPGNPVLSVYLNLDKRFAFIELRTMAEAAAALQMDGVLFRGMSLRMRRPNDYNPIAFPPVEPPVHGLHQFPLCRSLEREAHEPLDSLCLHRRHSIHRFLVLYPRKCRMARTRSSSAEYLITSLRIRSRSCSKLMALLGPSILSKTRTLA
mmetsp:Transcript_7957/g.35317  ORF Transcript_7957/g.35317 Transcript_7957/m.35317 type:complete len:285 (+) Transcript_7957:732-1586(+)